MASILLFIACGSESPQPQVEVIEVGGVLDAARLRYLRESVEEAACSRTLAIVQISSPATVAGLSDLKETAALIADPPLPLVVWLGPAPARVGGGAAQLLALAPMRAAAPGTVVENWDPATIGSTASLAPVPAGLPLEVSEPLPGLVDLVSPSIRQLIQDLDGRQVTVGGSQVTLDTLVDTAGGVTTVPVAFRKPGLLHRLFHLAAEPDAAFLFLVAGLTVAAFEFYALGPGIAATVAALSLLLGGYGLSNLPTRPWALVLVVLGVGILTAGFQQGGVLTLTVLGTLIIATGGLNLVEGAPQLRMSPVAVAASILAVLFFYLLAMPTVARARLSTPTLGREHLIGRRGAAITDLVPDGEVEVEGGRWLATGHRQAKIGRGDVVRVTGVNGWQLEVEPDREN